MKLRFGDLNAKADAMELAKNREKREAAVANAAMILRAVTVLPHLGSQLHGYPRPAQKYGIEACRDANKRVRSERIQP